MQTQLINFTIPKLLLKEVDWLAQKKQASRSELLREAVRSYLAKEKVKNEAFLIIKKAAERNKLSEKKVNELIEEAKLWARKNHLF